MDSTTNADSMNTISELSVLQPSDAVIYPNDSESIPQIFENIYTQIKEVYKELKKWDKPARPSCTIVGEKTVILRPEETLLENRIHVIRELTKSIKVSTDYEFPRYSGDGVWTIPLKLQEETDECKKLIERLETNTTKDQKYIEWLTKTKRVLNEMNEALEHSNPRVQELEVISSRIDKEYKNCKRDLNSVIEVLYPNSNVKKILGEVVEKSLNAKIEKDQWYEVTDLEGTSVIHNLFRFGIVVRNPRNSSQYKLALN